MKAFAVRVIGTRPLAAFTVALFVSLSVGALGFSLLYGYSSTINSALSGAPAASGQIIMQGSARAVYSSQVPSSIALSLSHLEGVDASAVTLTPTVLNGAAAVIRGLPSLSSLDSSIIEGQSSAGASILLGCELQKRVGLEVGDTVVVSSPFLSSAVALTVTGIYCTGDLRDYEAAVTLETGSALSGLSQGIANIITVGGISQALLEQILSSAYSLTVSFDFSDLPAGSLLITDPSGAPVATAPANGSGSSAFTLPFGYYTIAYQQSYFTANLTSVLLDGDREISLSLPTGTFDVYVNCPSSAPPTLRLSNGTSLTGEPSGEGWIFHAPAGVHTLTCTGTSLKILVWGDTAVSPLQQGPSLSKVSVSVFWQDGQPATGFLVTAWDANGTLVRSAESQKPSCDLLLPPGQYTLKVSKPPYAVECAADVPSQGSVAITLPRISTAYSIPVSLYLQLKAIAPIDASGAALGSLVGATTASLLVAFLATAALSAIAIYSVFRGLFSSCHENLKVLRLLGSSAWRVMAIISPALLAITIAASAASALAVWAAFSAFGLASALTFMGYGIPFSMPAALAYALAVGIMSWLISSAAALRNVEA